MTASLLERNRKVGEPTFRQACVIQVKICWPSRVDIHDAQIALIIAVYCANCGILNSSQRQVVELDSQIETGAGIANTVAVY